MVAAFLCSSKNGELGCKNVDPYLNNDHRLTLTAFIARSGIVIVWEVIKPRRNISEIFEI